MPLQDGSDLYNLTTFMNINLLIELIVDHILSIDKKLVIEFSTTVSQGKMEELHMLVHILMSILIINYNKSNHIYINQE